MVRGKKLSFRIQWTTLEERKFNRFFCSSLVISYFWRRFTFRAPKKMTSWKLKIGIEISFRREKFSSFLLILWSCRCIRSSIPSRLMNQFTISAFSFARQGGGCQFFSKSSKFKGHNVMSSYGFESGWDIEDLIKLGRRIRACPYYGTVSP